MQRQWTIEARADFADPAKNDKITQIFMEASVYIHANMALLTDGQKPQLVCYSDDFFKGREDIDIHGNPIAEAMTKHGAQMGGGDVSDELIRAAQDMAREK